MTIEIADHWFDFKKIDDDITLMWEPYVDPLLRCNIWHVRGRDRDMLVDTGLGIASLQEAAQHLFDKELDAVATHTHYDHIGGHFEFPNRICHKCEAQILAAPDPKESGLSYAGLGDEFIDGLRQSGYEITGDLITKLPHAGYDMERYFVQSAPATRIVDEGDVIDLGNRQFEIFHLPGHSPGSMGLWEKDTGILFSGDAVYDGPLLDCFEDASIPDYIKTMERLRELPVTVVHAGHDPSFGRDRLIELCDAYLASRK